MNIYTKSGDSGLASTINRRNIPKNSPVFSLLGGLDELSSALGLAKSKLPSDTREIVAALQQDLISFCTEIAGGEKFTTTKRVESMEQSIDMMMSATGKFEGFILPGATSGGAALDFARSIARRAERDLVACKQSGGISREAMMYLNRLSDLLYALARFTDGRDAAAEPTPKSVASFGSIQPITGTTFLDTSLWLCRHVLTYAMDTMQLGVVTACCDSGGNPVALLRADGAYIASVDVAQNKAYTSVSLQMPTENLAELCKPGGSLYGLQYTNGGRLVIFGGGFPMKQNGVIIGGFGVSGGSADQDTALCRWAQAQFDEKGGR